VLARQAGDYPGWVLCGSAPWHAAQVWILLALCGAPGEAGEFTVSSRQQAAR